MSEVKIQSKEIVLVDLNKIKLNPKNRNKHPKEQIEHIARIMKYQGFRRPGTISNRSGFLTCGEGRYYAAKKLKMKQMPVMYQDYDDEAQEYADGIADNALDKQAILDFQMINTDIIDLGPDFNLDMLGIKDFVLDISEKYEDQDLDEVPEEVEPIAKLGQIYKLGNHRLMCGSSTDKEQVLKLINNENIDMVYTDPPYGVKVVKSGKVGADFGIAKKGKYKEIINDETTDCAKEFYTISKELNLKNFILWGANYFTDCLEPMNSWVVWNKRGSTDIKNTFADCELAWSDIGFPCRIHSQLWNGMIRAGEKDKRVHPTQKPTALAEFCFDLLKESKSIYDGFGGSGSTLIACEKTNRKCFMMELDPHYIDIIIARWEKMTGQKAELLNG